MYLAMVEHFAQAVRGQTTLNRPPAHSIATLRILDTIRTTATT
jgi:hypothetical protein